MKKAIPLLNLLNNEPDIDKIYLYAKDPYEAVYKLLAKTRESTGLRYLTDSKTFIEYSNDVDDIYKTLKNKIKYQLYLIT